MFADWLNGAGLICNVAGVVVVFFFGVPRYRPLDDARKSYLMLETDGVHALSMRPSKAHTRFEFAPQLW